MMMMMMMMMTEMMMMMMMVMMVTTLKSQGAAAIQDSSQSNDICEDMRQTLTISTGTLTMKENQTARVVEARKIRFLKLVPYMWMSASFEGS